MGVAVLRWHSNFCCGAEVWGGDALSYGLARVDLCPGCWAAGCRGGDLRAGQEKPNESSALRGEYAVRWLGPSVSGYGQLSWPYCVSKAWPRALALQLKSCIFGFSALNCVGALGRASFTFAFLRSAVCGELSVLVGWNSSRCVRI